MKCPKCGSDLDTGFNCVKCDYKHNQKQLSTTEKMIVIKTDLKEMPKGCASPQKKMCPFFKHFEKVREAEGYFPVCKANRGAGYKIVEDIKTCPEWCPLIEIKESKNDS